jgi:Uri superfamily endonuclease
VVEDIHSVDNFTDQQEELEITSNRPRKVFVDTGVPTYFSSNFSGVVERYREFVIGQLELEEWEIDSIEKLPEVLEKVSSQKSVKCFVAETERAVQILREDNRSERTFGSGSTGAYTFNGVPVIRDWSDRYTAVVLYDSNLKYEEREPAISVSVTPGEEIKAWTKEKMRKETVPADFVQICYSYEAVIQGEANGIVIRVQKPD